MVSALMQRPIAYWTSIVFGAAALIALVLPLVTTGATVQFGQSNSRNGRAVIVATDVVPGQTRSSSVTIANTGVQPIRFRLTQDRVATTFTSALRLRIYDTTTRRCIYPARASVGNCTAWGAWKGGRALTGYSIKGKPKVGTTTPSTTFARGEKHSIRVSWYLLRTATNADQRRRGTFRLLWVAAQ